MRAYEPKPGQLKNKTNGRSVKPSPVVSPHTQTIMNLQRLLGNRETLKLLRMQDSGAIHREPLEPDPKAVAAGNLASQWQQTNYSPGIWFDDWDDDERDNDNNGKIDDEPPAADGIHYRQAERPAKICAHNPMMRIDDPNCRETKDITVVYKVCIDIPKEAYSGAGISSFPGEKRDVGEVMRGLRWKRGWRILRENGMNRLGFTGQLADGDFVANGNHSGVGYGGKVIHLPGQTSRRTHFGGRSNPSKPNDLYMTDDLWHGGSSFVARFVKAEGSNPPGPKAMDAPDVNNAEETRPVMEVTDSDSRREEL